jgi:hypothetical protein
LHGKKTVNIDVSIRDLANDENLINWYLTQLGYEWADLAIAIVNRHIVTLMTVDNKKVLLGVNKINGELKGAIYDRHLLHYPIYGIRNTERYCHEKFKKSYQLSKMVKK